jgi:hypothetical protein
MRAAGHPARVVTGYLGGEVHPTENFVTVRQYDAHAWAEVWVEGQGWVRVDPTAAVAPERVEMSLADLFRDEDSFLADSTFSLIKFRDFGLINWIILQRDYLDYAWATWVLGYDSRQVEVLNRLLGEVNVLRISLMLAVAGAIAMFPFLLLRLYRRFQNRPDPRDALIHRFCNRMARAGIPRRTGEGISDYARRIARESPELGPAAIEVAESYVRQRYDQSSPADIGQLRALVRG